MIQSFLITAYMEYFSVHSTILVKINGLFFPSLTDKENYYTTQNLCLNREKTLLHSTAPCNCLVNLPKIYRNQFGIEFLYHFILRIQFKQVKMLQQKCLLLFLFDCSSWILFARLSLVTKSANYFTARSKFNTVILFNKRFQTI